MTTLTKRLLLWALAVAFIALLGATAYKAGEQHSVAPEPTITEYKASSATNELPGFTQSWSGSGPLTVGTELAPGSYLVYSDGSAGGCLWQRLKKNDQKVSSLNEQGNLARGAPSQLMRVERTDRFVRMYNCAFQKAL